MKSNKKLIIVISIVLALAVASGVFAYLFIMTDIFRSNNELFSKYFLQNTVTFGKIMDLQVEKSYEQLKNENKYESNTNIKIVHSEGGEISNPFNNLSAKLDIQNNNEEQYMYANTKALFDNEEYLNAEIIKDQGQYGIRFSDVAKKFVTIENDENIESIAEDIGIDTNELLTLINIIDGKAQITSNEQNLGLKDKYLNIIKTGVSNGIFEKQKNALITYNNATTETNAYSVLLSSEQVKGILIEILNSLKSETNLLEQVQELIEKETAINIIDGIIESINEQLEVPTIKITVYEQKRQTIRTVFEIGTHKITVENAELGAEIKSNISYSNNNQAVQYNIQIVKTNSSNQEKFEIIIETPDDENSTINITNEMQLVEEGITNNFQIYCEQGIKTIGIELENKVTKGIAFEKTESLVQGNYLLLNANGGEPRKQFIETYKKKILEKMTEQIDLLGKKLLLTNESIEDVQGEEQISPADINKFNAKFEFYTGDEVSAENVKKLLESVRGNINGHIITNIGSEDNIEEQKNVIKIYIEKEQTNETSMTEILEKIKDNQKYKVLISYKEGNGLIDFITITEI